MCYLLKGFRTSIVGKWASPDTLASWCWKSRLDTCCSRSSVVNTPSQEVSHDCSRKITFLDLSEFPSFLRDSWISESHESSNLIWRMNLQHTPAVLNAPD